MKQKQTFAIIFALLAVLLALLPFLVSFNEILTRMVEKFRLYMWVQERIVPLEVKMVAVLVRPLGIDYLAHQNGMTVNGTYAQMTWNCLGWQSLLLFLVTLFVGLRGNYTFWSKAEAIFIGLLGTFLVNLLRVVLIVVILALSRPLFAIVFHDYLAAIVTIIWLFFFWWFSYSFVLEEGLTNTFISNIIEMNEFFDGENRNKNLVSGENLVSIYRLCSKLKSCGVSFYFKRLKRKTCPSGRRDAALPKNI